MLYKLNRDDLEKNLGNLFSLGVQCMDVYLKNVVIVVLIFNVLLQGVNHIICNLCMEYDHYASLSQ